LRYLNTTPSQEQKGLNTNKDLLTWSQNWYDTTFAFEFHVQSIRCSNIDVLLHHTSLAYLAQWCSFICHTTTLSDKYILLKGYCLLVVALLGLYLLYHNATTHYSIEFSPIFTCILHLIAYLRILRLFCPHLQVHSSPHNAALQSSSSK
jgi:hypothetical protein